MSLVLQSFLPYPNSCLGTSPHQQGRDTKMAQRSFCGIDVAKDLLDVMVLLKELCWSVVNDAAGWAELVARLRGLHVTATSGVTLIRSIRRRRNRPEPQIEPRQKSEVFSLHWRFVESGSSNGFPYAVASAECEARDRRDFAKMANLAAEAKAARKRAA